MVQMLRCPRGHTYSVPNGDTGSQPLSCPLCITHTEGLRFYLNIPESPATTELGSSGTILEPPPAGLPLVPDSSLEDQPTREVQKMADDLDPPTLSLPPEPSEGPHSDPESLPRLEIPGPPGYEILREIGRGGMGVVYLARNTSDGTQVALKMIRAEAPGSSHGETVEQKRFLTEARALLQLDHPNIVHVLEVGDFPGPQGSQPYFTLEYVSGGTLEEYLRGRPQSATIAARLLIVLARAIQAAHDQGIVHRDLKPANVLIAGPECAEEGAAPRLEDRLKVADFGLAQFPQCGAERTRTGWIIGTPSYMAPEQAAGKIRQIGPATDVWALGAILYECLTGRPPFQGATVLETLNLVQEADPLPPRRLVPDIPRALETICLKCLEKAPQRRYASAGDLANDLGRYLNSLRIYAQRPTFAEVASRWLRRHPLPTTFLCAVLLILFCMGLGAASYTWRLERTFARVEEANQREQAARESALLKQQELEEREVLLQEYRYAASIQQAQQLWTQGQLMPCYQILEPYLFGNQLHLRDFACRHLEFLLHGSVTHLVGHQGDVFCLAWSPDGNTLVSAGKDGFLRSWEATGRLRFEVHAHREDINAVAFSPDGKRVATGSDDCRIGLWNAETGLLEAYLPSTGSQVIALTFSANGRELYSGTHQGALLAWSLDQVVVTSRRIASVGDRIHQLTLDPQGRRLAVAADNQGVALVDLNNPRKPVKIKLQSIKALAVAFTPSGRYLAVGTNDGQVILLDTDTRQEISRTSAHIGRIHALAFTPDERYLITTGQDALVRLWEPMRLHPAGQLRGHAARLWAVAVSSVGDQIATSDGSGAVNVWPAQPSMEHRTIEIPTGGLLSLATRPELPLAVAGSSAGVVLLPITGSHHGVPQVIPKPNPVVSLALSPDRRRLLLGLAGGQVYLHNLADGTARMMMQSSRDHLPVAFSARGTIAAAGDSDGHVHLWQMPEGKPLPCKITNGSAITALAFLPGATEDAESVRLVLADILGNVAIWKLDGEKPIAAAWQAHPRDILRVVPNASGTVLATMGEDRCINLWDVATRQKLHIGLYGHEHFVVDASFSPDGRNLATASQDGTVRIWSLATGREMLLLKHPGPVHGVAFLDANRLLTIGKKEDNQGFARIYQAVPQ